MRLKWYSRKLLIMAIATGLVLFGKISDWVWLFVAVAYIGGNLIDKLIKFKQIGGDTADAIGEEIQHTNEATPDPDSDDIVEVPNKKVEEVGFKK